ILIKDPRRQEVEALSGGKNTVIYDAQGNPNVMVVIPRFNIQDLGLTALDLGAGTHTAFITNGAPRSEILIAKYLASAGGSTCSVVGGVQPMSSVNYDQSLQRCNTKGTGWHLMSIHERAAIALLSLANGTVPRGNTNYGRSHERLFETARRADNGMPGDTSGTGRTDTGKGPAAWTHDHTDFGIHDLVGNCWEWIGQMLLESGQIKTTLDNNPSALESAFTAHPAFYDRVGSAIKLNNRITSVGSANSEFKAISKDAVYVPNLILRQLLLETATTNTLGGRVYVNNEGQRAPISGGHWSHGADAGLAALNLSDARSHSDGGLGFRPAYFT
ncbi:MAG: SUMF1/EgtB/PvdO family nonheme iron enzyme, partial [Shewanella sp.]